jgi:hypothetical protein
MGIELGWVKKNTHETGGKFNSSYLTDYSSKHRIFNIPKTQKPSVFREIGTFSGIGKPGNSNSPSINQAFASKSNHFSQVPCRTSSLGTCIRMMMSTEIQYPVYMIVNGSRRLNRVVVTFSFSYFKRTYPHNWKNSFGHLLEKSNLLIRSDKNTGVSSLKILQTTTI